ncbi:hypothetical protein ACGFT2_33030 [Streptomyces sp. NPDC048514]|uniref:hypothetical protein n=1 Tax=Streptomyces sp. NPDC048514 TaxID=3365564 RepID=UPI00371CA7DD
MGSLSLTLCTGILAVAAFTPAAHAADGGSVSVTPAAPAPGADVTVQTGGCTGGQGTATSGAFVADALLTGGQGSLAGETQVRTSVTPGTYDVKVTCSGRVLTGRITVAAGGSGGLGQLGQLQQLLRPPSDSASPVAPVHAGGGGTAHFATVATSGSGPGTLQEVTGLALAGIAAVAVGFRTRRSRGTR